MGGGLKLKEIYPRYYINTDAIICVVDSSDVKRVDQAREFLFTALKHENLDPCRTVLILLNKQVFRFIIVLFLFTAKRRARGSFL